MIFHGSWRILYNMNLLTQPEPSLLGEELNSQTLRSNLEVCWNTRLASALMRKLSLPYSPELIECIQGFPVTEPVTGLFEQFKLIKWTFATMFCSLEGSLRAPGSGTRVRCYPSLC